MFVRSISTCEYDVDLEKLLIRRLKYTGQDFEISEVRKSGTEQIVEVEMHCDNALKIYSSAVALLLLKDLAHFELARIVNTMSLSLVEKQRILPEAIKNAKAIEDRQGVARELTEHFSENENLNLEGFMRFRMKDVLAEWELCVDRAVEELWLQTEYMELMSILNAFVNIKPTRVKEVSLRLNADGSCTLADDTDTRIDCTQSAGEGLMNILMGLSPEHITVYDQSGGKNQALNDMLLKVFAGRIRFYN